MAKLEHIKACVPLLHTTFMESKISIPENEWAQINLDTNKTENINKILHREIDIANGLNEFCKNQNFLKN